MPSEAQLARVNTASVPGKIAARTAQLAEQLRNLQIQQSPAHCCSVFNSGNIAIASGGYTALSFDTVLYDSFGMFSVVTPTRINCIVPGKYIVMANARWAASVSHANGAGIRFYLNGTTIFGEFEFVSCNIRTMNLSQPVHLANVGDYVEVMVIQNTGAPVNISTASRYSPTFGVHKYG